jgi:hypothetical protein
MQRLPSSDKTDRSSDNKADKLLLRTWLLVFHLIRHAKNGIFRLELVRHMLLRRSTTG